MLGFDIRWREVPIIIKIGMLFWLVAVACFVFMVASAITPLMSYPATTLLKVAYFGGTMFIIGIVLMIIGLPGVKNHHKG